MAISTLNIAIETQLKADAELLCGKVGVSITDLVNEVFRKMVITGELPVKVKKPLSRAEVIQFGKEAAIRMREQSAKNGNSEMTMDEIDEIIAKSRRERGLYDKVSA
ncbi:hypothetical protein FACS1894133_4150 [Clostridia bacterium]|nr:hypothetical protein FACS1894133_4150 [Clostridia bacterium]